MDIKDIIGQGKAFEPPFKTDDYGGFIYDRNNEMFLEMRGYGHLRYIFDETALGNQVYQTLANHIVELLNERWEK